MSEQKICKGCGKIFHRPNSLSASKWEERLFCSQPCSNNSYKRNRIKDPKPAVAIKASGHSMLGAKSRALVKRFFAKPVQMPEAVPPGDHASWSSIMPDIKWADAQRQIAQMEGR